MNTKLKIANSNEYVEGKDLASDESVRLEIKWVEVKLNDEDLGIREAAKRSRAKWMNENPDSPR